MSTVSKIKVLVVDDAVSFAELLKQRLSDSLLAVETATSLSEAWQRLSTEDFSVVILDLVFEPAEHGTLQSGVDLLRALRATRPDIQIIILSGHLSRFAEHLHDLGVPALSKAELDIASLRQAIYAALAARREVGPPDERGRAAQHAADAIRLEDIRRVFVEEASRLLYLKDRTVAIPGEALCANNG